MFIKLYGNCVISYEREKKEKHTHIQGKENKEDSKWMKRKIKSKGEEWEDEKKTSPSMVITVAFNAEFQVKVKNSNKTKKKLNK